MQKVLTNLKAEKALGNHSDNDQNVSSSTKKNIADMKTATPATINTYDVMNTTPEERKGCRCIYRESIRIMASIQYYDVIIRPVITEKPWQTWVRRNIHSLYIQEAHKAQIEAVEKMFEGTKVKSINTINSDERKNAVEW